MVTLRRMLVFPLIVLMLAPSVARADAQHVVPTSQLTAAVADHVAAQDADRAAIREALQRPEVRNVAASMGVDMTRASAAVATMTGGDLTQAARAARQVNEQLVGGASTIVISTTTVIIILLVIILIILAVK